mgnify:CR=1 FL=1|jgi:hypothetical protein
MREMNISDIQNAADFPRRASIIKTKSSRKPRPEDEMIMLMNNARRRFKKQLDEGRIEIVSEREWILR